MSENNRDNERRVNGERSADAEIVAADGDGRIVPAEIFEDDAQTAVISTLVGSSQPDRAWTFGAWETETAQEDRATRDPYVGLVNLGFIRGALRRRWRLWVSLALIGFVAGFGFLAAKPPAQQASATLLLQSPPGSPAGQAIANDQALIESRMMAANAVAKLGLRETPASFLGSYSAAVVTDQILTITAKAASSAEAIREANALANLFIAMQVKLLNQQNQLANVAYSEQVASAKQDLDSLGKQITALKAGTPGGRSAQISKLQDEFNQASTDLAVLKQTVSSTEATNQTTNATVIAGSKVLDSAAPVKQSRKRQLALYAGGGLLGGLAIGIMIVLIGALVSDKIRRRDDVARIMGAPVQLSVGPIRSSRWLPNRRGMAIARHRNARRIAAYLGDAVALGTRQHASLAVVPLDEVQVPAVCLVSLAVSCAQQGLRVVVADLCTGTPVARLFRTTEPGIHGVNVKDVPLTLIVPERDGAPLPGPFRKPAWAQVDEPVARACKSADVILSLATVDPAVGAEYLSGWTASVVAMVTAGESSAQRVFSVGEMIRLSGMHSTSAVLVGADKSDESLGLVPGSTVRQKEAGITEVLSGAKGYLAIAEHDLSTNSVTQSAGSEGTGSD